MKITIGKHQVIIDDCIELPSNLYMHKKGYAQMWVGGRNVLLHRYIMGAKPDQEIDHINGNKLDNRMVNLRFCTKSENMHNRRTWSKYGHKGICKNGKKWQANIYKGGRRYCLGNFDSIEQAVLAYRDKSLELYGSYAYNI